MKNDNKIPVAIIGNGFISEYHINGLAASNLAEITTLIGRNDERTMRRAREFGIPNCSTDLHDVLADPVLNAVVIATPDSTHKSIAIEALTAGKNVLLQKPMAMNSAECKEIIDAAAESGSKLSVSFMHRYFPEVRWLRQHIREKTFGEIQSVRLRNATSGADWAAWLFDSKKVAGGVIMQLGVHGIDLLQYLFGPISVVSAFGSTMKPSCRLADGQEVIMKLEDNVVAIYKLAAGFNATHEMSWTEPAGCDRFRLEVYFEDGTVWLRTEQSSAMFSRDRTGELTNWKSANLPSEPLGKFHHKNWLETLRDDTKTDGTAQAGLSATIVAEKLYDSISEDRSLNIPKGLQ